MAGPWEKYGQQSSEIVATPLPRNPYDVQADQRDNAREDRTESYDRGDRVFDNTKKFRDEFRALPSVTEYNIALRTYATAINTPATPEGDQALITSFARLMDPNSVVREGEFATAAGNESAFARIKAQFAKEFGLDGAGRLTAEGRSRLRETMRGVVVDGFQTPYERDRQQYQRFAQMEGVDPYMVVGEPVGAGFPPGLLDPPKVKESLSVAPGGQEVDKLPQEYQDAHYAYLQQNWGRIDPEGYARFRAGLDERYGQTPDPDAYRAAVTGYNEAAALGGSPADLGAVPSPNSDMGWMESQLNSAAQTGTGAFYANAGNALAAGLPARLSGNQNRLEDIRDINPGESFAGELAGGIAGTVGAGAGLRGAAAGLSQFEKAGKVLASPTAANLIYGGTYGAMQDDNHLRGAAVGLGGALLGDVAGRAIGGAFPSTFNRSGFRAADDSVPTVDQLQEQASGLYQQAEANGVTASPESVNEMIARAAAILRNEGGMTPRDNITAGTDVSRGMTMLGDFADTPMTSTQAGSVRKLLGEGRTAMRDGAPDYSQRRVAGNILDSFDEWAEPALPGVEDARKVAQRAILGREMATANELATGPKAAQFTQSGEENALRSVFRGLDTAEVKGRNSYPDALTEKIQEVSRGTPFSNAMRTLGKFAPNSAVSAIPTLAASGVGASVFGPLGAAAGPVLAGAGMFGRKIATGKTQRAAKEAELIARGADEYLKLLEAAKKAAAARGGQIGAGMTAPSTMTTR